MSEKSLITDTLREQILAVRDTGRTNMFAVNEVQRIADELEFFELVSFLTDEKNKKAYCKFILYGDKRD